MNDWAKVAEHIAEMLDATEHTYEYDRETHTLQMTVRLSPALEYIEVTFQKPPPSKTCGSCGETYDWTWYEGEWDLDAEHWSNAEHEFLCCVTCWRKAEGYVWTPGGYVRKPT